MNVNMNTAMKLATTPHHHNNNHCNVNNITFGDLSTVAKETSVRAAKTFSSTRYADTSAINWRKIGLVALGIFLGITGISSTTIVGPGQRGAKVLLGKVQPTVLDEGIHVKWPFVESVQKMNVRTQKVTDSTETYTKDVQQAMITYTVNYNVVPNEANSLYQKVGKNYEDVIIDPAVFGALKDVIGKWDATDLVGNRDKARLEIKDNLNEKLRENHIEVTNFELENVRYSPDFTKAIEDKVTEAEKAKKAENKTKRIEEEAKQQVIAAKGEAEAMQIKADALSRNPGLTKWEAVQRWDGKLPQYMGGNGPIPFIGVQ